MTEDAVVIIIPVLRRPHRVATALANAHEATPEPHRVLFVATEDDDDEIDALSEAGADWIMIAGPPLVGDYARKINNGYKVSTEPFIFTAADDLKFHTGWFTAAVARMHANPRIGVVGTQDLGSPRVRAGQHSTHSLVRRTYAEKFGTIDERDKILCEAYPHEFVDDELVGTAIRRRAFAFARDSVVEHMHPNWGKGETDALYDAQGDRMRVGRVIYQRRRKLWM